ncbi:hypothetical protein D3C78_1713620 [compost metagenome]
MPRAVARVVSLAETFMARVSAAVEPIWKFTAADSLPLAPVTTVPSLNSLAPA